MTKAELERECQARGMKTDKKDKPQLQNQLTNHLHGVQRVPSLMLNHHTQNLEEFQLHQYEVMPVEPLHDIKEHNKNIFTKLPHYLNENELKIFNSTKEYVTESRERLRGCDYRIWAVLLALRMSQKARITVCCLVNALAELSQLCYAPANKRTPRFILRFYNVAFLHAITVLQFFFPVQKH